jgi:hypothetical protein
LRYFIGENDIVLGFDGLVTMDITERLLDLISNVDQLSD